MGFAVYFPQENGRSPYAVAAKRGSLRASPPSNFVPHSFTLVWYVLPDVFILLVDNIWESLKRAEKQFPFIAVCPAGTELLYSRGDPPRTFTFSRSFRRKVTVTAVKGKLHSSLSTLHTLSLTLHTLPIVCAPMKGRKICVRTENNFCVSSRIFPHKNNVENLPPGGICAIINVRLRQFVFPPAVKK